MSMVLSFSLASPFSPRPGMEEKEWKSAFIPSPPFSFHFLDRSRHVRRGRRGSFSPPLFSFFSRSRTGGIRSEGVIAPLSLRSLSFLLFPFLFFLFFAPLDPKTKNGAFYLPFIRRLFFFFVMFDKKIVVGATCIDFLSPPLVVFFSRREERRE